MDYHRYVIALKPEDPGFQYKSREPAGRCTIESRDKTGKISLNAQDLKAMTSYKVAIIFFSKDGYEGLPLGTVFIDEKGKGEFKREFPSQNMAGSSNLNDFISIALLTPNPNELKTPLVGFKDSPVHWKRHFKLIVPEGSESGQSSKLAQGKSESILSQRSAQESPASPSLQAGEALEPPSLHAQKTAAPLASRDGSEIAPTLLKLQSSEEAKTVSRLQQDIEASMPGAVDKNEPFLPEEFAEPGSIEFMELGSKAANEASSLSHAGLIAPEAQSETMPGAPKAQAETEEFLAEPPISPQKTEISTNARKPADPNGPTSGRAGQKDLHGDFKSVVEDYKQNEENANLDFITITPASEKGEVQPETSPDAENQASQELNRIFEVNHEMQPFEKQSQDISWVRISMREPISLPINYSKIFNTPFVISSYKKYKHFIIGRVNEQNGRIYTLGIPGTYDIRDIKMAKSLGFTQFKCVDNVTPAYGEYGYYLMSITL
ncbi:MAG: hypothetical protein LBU32_29140 [Clostridiales bacterium]|jgi:hypothetical protein|nr:hypothetical protein [Clostridiales bacterium]